MFAVILMSAPVMPVWATFVLYALAFGCVGMVGLPALSQTQKRLFVGALVAFLVGGAAVSYAAVIDEPYTYGWCAYVWLINWMC